MTEALKCDQCGTHAIYYGDPLAGEEENAQMRDWFFVAHNRPEFPQQLHFCGTGCLRDWAGGEEHMRLHPPVPEVPDGSDSPV